ncbi:MAG: hypothetical protein ACTSWY_14820 [Promethearchaeota archaeon]
MDTGKVVSMNPELQRFLEVCQFCNNSEVNPRFFWEKKFKISKLLIIGLKMGYQLLSFYNN